MRVKYFDIFRNYYKLINFLLNFDFMWGAPSGSKFKIEKISSKLNASVLYSDLHTKVWR